MVGTSKSIMELRKSFIGPLHLRSKQDGHVDALETQDTPVSPPHTTAQLSRIRALAPNRHSHELLLLVLQGELVSLHWVRVQAAIALLQPKLFLLRGFVNYNFVDSP